MNILSADSKRLNFLVLDGGGVRGLSSLLILQALMDQINKSLTDRGVDSGELHPYHVFRLVAGTSTGGLIALMLGKIGMTIGDCITQYEMLSKVIFGKKHIRGRLTRGLAPAKYSGKRLQNCMQGLLRDCGRDVNMSMRNDNDSIACAVVCREHCSSSQYSKLKSKAVPICSLPCNGNLTCKVCDAARATSAAPTFFPVMRIGDRFFADGGLGHNNPSFAIYFHYLAEERKKSTKSMASADSAPHYSTHGDLDCSRVRFTNIGTGAKVSEVEPRKRDRLASFIPGFIRKGAFLKQTLTEIAVNSEEKVVVLRQFQYLNPDRIMYERFDANHGVSNIKLDDYKALKDIRDKTNQYLGEQATQKLLAEVGSAIATDYLNTLPADVQVVEPANNAVEQSRQTPQLSTSISVSATASSGPPSHSDLESESHTLFPHDDNLQKVEPAPSAEFVAKSNLPLNGQGCSTEYAHEDSGVDVVGPEALTEPAPA